MTHDTNGFKIPISRSLYDGPLLETDEPETPPAETLRDGGHSYRYYGGDEVACSFCGHAPWMRPYPCPVTTSERFRRILAA